MAAGMNKRIFYTRITSNSANQLATEQEYSGTVKEVQLNSQYAAVLVDAKVPKIKFIFHISIF